MFNELTYSQRNLSFLYYCSSKDSGCKARFKLRKDNAIVSSYVNYINESPKYFKSKTAEYIRQMERKEKRLLFNV